MCAFSFLLKEMSQWPDIQWKLASKTNEATLKSSWRSTPRKEWVKWGKMKKRTIKEVCKLMRRKVRSGCICNIHKKNYFPTLQPAQKRQRENKPVTKDDYRPETDISETMEWVKISVNLIKNRMCQPRQPQYGCWAAWEKKVQQFLYLMSENVSNEKSYTIKNEKECRRN